MRHLRFVGNASSQGIAATWVRSYVRLCVSAMEKRDYQDYGFAAQRHWPGLAVSTERYKPEDLGRGRRTRFHPDSRRISKTTIPSYAEGLRIRRTRQASPGSPQNLKLVRSFEFAAHGSEACFIACSSRHLVKAELVKLKADVTSSTSDCAKVLNSTTVFKPLSQSEHPQLCAQSEKLRFDREPISLPSPLLATHRGL